MGRKSTLTQEQVDDIIDLYKSGYGSPTIAKMLDLKTSQITYCVSKNIGLRSSTEANRRYEYDQTYFEKINTSEKAYWLGFVYADGYVAGSPYKRFGIALSVKDIEHLEVFKEHIKATYPVRTYEPSESNYSTGQYCRIQIFGEAIYNNLVNHGVVAHKTLIVRPPVLDESLVPHFIRGYFDGDGSLSVSNRSNGRTEYTAKICGTHELLSFIKDFIEQNNVATINQFYKRRPTDEVWGLELPGHYQVKNFLDLIYKDSTIHLERKYRRYQELSCLLHSRADRKRSA